MLLLLHGPRLLLTSSPWTVLLLLLADKLRPLRLLAGLLRLGQAVLRPRLPALLRVRCSRPASRV